MIKKFAFILLVFIILIGYIFFPVTSSQYERNKPAFIVQHTSSIKSGGNSIIDSAKIIPAVNLNSIALPVNRTITYVPDISGGIIGTADSAQVDNPYDNIFHINLPTTPNENYTFYLQYKLYGVSSHAGVARSINDAQAIGGRFVQFNNQWTSQKEVISSFTLHKGDNVLRFGLPLNASYQYSVKDVRLVAEIQNSVHQPLIINQPDKNYFGNQAYIKGVIQAYTKAGNDVRIYCDGHPVKVYNNEFEAVISKPANNISVFTSNLKVVFSNGKIINKTVVFSNGVTAYREYEPEIKGQKNEGRFVMGNELNLSMYADSSKTGIKITGKALPNNKIISITNLRDIDLPPLNADLVNVTKGSQGYRFLPHGSKFSIEAKIAIPFDSTLIPEGYTAADIRTYYFDEFSRSWEVLPLDTVLANEGIVCARTSHFTDMINGIIKVPESPETQAYVQNSIKDLKAADPSSGITLINPPVAGSMGGASLNFSLKLPAGRQGLQPALSIQYSNQGGNGWVGYGWNLSIPSVGIETRWGVPRYDNSLETETYTVNGQQLAPVAHRGALQPRTPDKTFTSRVEGTFNRTTRHGNSPANYWWEVTGKDGTSNYYGGTPASGVINSAVLKDDNGNIGHWALVETRSPDDNFVRYEYEQVNDPGIIGGTLAGKQLYCSKIYYTGNGTTNGAYAVEFIRDRQLGEPKRKDIDISGTLGFKMVSADLLRQVKISFNQQLIRTYECTYKQGAFFKTLLKDISEFDAAGALFYTHKFDYYDDVASQQGYDLLNSAQNWNPVNDNIRGDLLNSIPGFTSEGSALSTSKSSNINGGLALTLGSGYGGFWSKLLSIGGSYGYGQDKSEGLVSLIDINGDGLPDKVFKQNGNLYYRSNPGNTSQPFGGMRPILGVNDFSISNSKNVSWGFQVIPLVFFAGNNTTTTTSTTSVYFSDFNGDGLMDLVKDGHVYFNHLNAAGDPEFDQSSTLTPSPINTSGNSINQAFFTRDTALQTRQENQFPLQDVVRLWEAPFDGTIKLNAPVKLKQVPAQSGILSNKKDGVRVSIQVGNNEVWSTIIAATDYAIKNPSGVNNISISKGQHIYFRVESIYNGEDDIVDWDPEIDYLTPVSPAFDANNRSGSQYKSSSDFILDNKSLTHPGKNGTIRINGNFSKGVTSDTVIARILLVDAGGIQTEIYRNTFGCSAIYNGQIVVYSLVVDTTKNLRFVVESTTYVDRSKVKWKPHFEYIAYTDNTPVTNSLGQPTMQGYVVPENINFNRWKTPTPLMRSLRLDTVKIKPSINAPVSANGLLIFSIKSIDTIYTKRTLQITNGQIANTIADISLIRQAGQPLYLEYTAADTSLALALTNTRAIVYKDSANNTYIDTVNAGLYTNPSQDYLGTMFRGWGQFAFKGNRISVPLNESLLNQNELHNNNYPTDPDAYMDSTTFSQLQDPSKTNFVTLYANAEKDAWVGYDTAVSVGNNIMTSSRIWMHDVSVDSLMAGQAANAVSKISSTNVKSNSVGFSLGISGSKGYTNAQTITLLDMMDMNGDRFPDILNQTSIQYTLPNGGLEAIARTNNVGTSVSTGRSEGFSLGGGMPVAFTTRTTGNNAQSEQKEACVSIGFSGNTGTNEDNVTTSWNDINGDGLQDKVYENGTVALNLGYKFLPAENWGAATIDKGSTTSQSVGFGVNIDAASFQGGFGLSRSNGGSSSGFQDINGDGLPDKIEIVPGGFSVRLNTGNGFSAPMLWNNFTAISSNVSTGESINAAFTIVIPIPIPFFPLKVCINPSFSTGHGVSRRQDQIMDINGDGYPDLLMSQSDGNLTAKLSTIGRTNMLSRVQRPMGGSFTLDYERLGNTYDLPQSKWVLKSVEVVDGLAGDGADTVRTRFSYEGGMYNRHEREFYGFSKVTSEQLNTAAGNIVYRRQVQKFLNNSYYDKGLLQSEWSEDAAGNKFTQTNNLYSLRNVQTNSEYPALIQTEKLFYEGQATAGMSTTTQFDYDAIGNVTKIIDAGDGSAQDLITADVTYHNNNNLYIKSVPASIVVTTAEGVKRKRTTTIDNQGNITRIQQFLADGSSANTDMEYDIYGNLLKITRPANHKSERMWYGYEYDNMAHSYVTKVTDAFGYSSTSTYDLAFGAVTGTVSMNNEPMRYVLDNRGRIVRITGPYEIAAGKPYTILQEYHPEATVPYAVTKHYDPEYNADISTVTFMDGLARPVQVKKQASVFKGKNVDDEVRMIISGRIIYDAFGRAEKTYYPVTEPIGAGNINFSTSFGTIASTTTYDVQDRQLTNVLADGATTKMVYSIANQRLVTRTTDALNNSKETLTDVRGRNRSTRVFGGPNGTITTNFVYNAISELLNVTDTKGNITAYTYDNLGRKLSVKHPDAGLTELSYDLAGNLLEKKTAQLRKEIPNGGAIKYTYRFERLTDIDYPRYYQNKVKYIYGDTGRNSRTGRLILVQDGSGGQEFFYGKLGEITKTIRTVMVSPIYTVTYVSEQEYDTWNRVKKMVYPDGEEVTYHYNKGGSLKSFEGKKLGNDYKYLEQLGYDEYEQRVYSRYGNGTETEYKYDALRRRLLNLKALTATGRAMMNNQYNYDAVSNILGIVNNVTADSGKLGGYAKQDYEYDNLYRLVKSKGIYRGATVTNSYNLDMGYDDLYNVVSKKMTNGFIGQSYDYAYIYNGAAPHQLTEAGGDKYTYDANGNQLGTKQTENFWDEENRLVAVLKDGTMNRYTYDANGERVIKSSGGIQGIWVNGAPAGSIKHDDNFTIYVSPYLVCRKAAFTKHYYIESQRITSKIGYGTFTNISFPASGLTAGGIDYRKRAEAIELARIRYYASQSLSPGPPTDKNFWGRPENNGIVPPVFVDTTASTVPPGWPPNPNTPNYGQPVTTGTLPSRDSVHAGYGFDGTGHNYERSQYFYHPDHLGSTSYVTDVLGEVTQHVEYSAFGETFFEEHATSTTMPYLFNAKERDAETGLYYYGARYYNAKLSQWLSVDPKTDKYPELSGYNYTLNNPVKMTDPDGKEPKITEQNFVAYKGKNTCDCFCSSKQQLGKFDMKLTNERIDLYDKKGEIIKEKLEKAVKYIDETLSKDKPVMIGVDEKGGTSNNHFLTITNKGKDEKGNFYQYTDNATKNFKNATSEENKLYISDKGINASSKPSFRQNVEAYKVTTVRQATETPALKDEKQ